MLKKTGQLPLNTPQLPQWVMTVRVKVYQKKNIMCKTYRLLDISKYGGTKHPNPKEFQGKVSLSWEHHPRSPENVHHIFSSFKNILIQYSSTSNPNLWKNITTEIHVCPSSLTPLVPSAFSPCLIGEFGTARQHQEKKNKFKHRKKSRLCPGKHVQELLAAESLSHGCVFS